ncbi:MAG: hypothetical protein INR65_11205 [Gluconacetobacter diazotrophicus]|nr:hypothetical protein [Gluconacetobacter diazotrophicus]
MPVLRLLLLLLALGGQLGGTGLRAGGEAVSGWCGAGAAPTLSASRRDWHEPALAVAAALPAEAGAVPLLSGHPGPGAPLGGMAVATVDGEGNGEARRFRTLPPARGPPTAA